MQGTVDRLKRIPLYLFLVVFAYFGIKGEELWPMTGWRLFSALRTDHQTSWEVDYVDAQGRSKSVPFGQMSWAYRGFPQVLSGFPRLSREERLGVCSAWLRALQAMSIDPVNLEIHRTEWFLSERHGPRARPPKKVLAFTCSVNDLQER